MDTGNHLGLSKFSFFIWKYWNCIRHAFHVDPEISCNMVLSGDKHIWTVFAPKDYITIMEGAKKHHISMETRATFILSTGWLNQVWKIPLLDSFLTFKMQQQISHWKIEQDIGDLVFVPPGYAHFTENVSSIFLFNINFIL